MDYAEILQSGIDYIEENILADISAQELASRAGFSLYHYCRLFQSAVGMPVKQYTVRRKLLHALHEIKDGQSMTDAALTYGFYTYAGFYKACKREFGFTPRELIRIMNETFPRPYQLYQGEKKMISNKSLRELLSRWNMEASPISPVFDPGGNQEKGLWQIGQDKRLLVTEDLGQLNARLAIDGAMAAHGLLAPVPLESINGQRIETIDGAYACLYQPITGAPFLLNDVYENPEIGYALGEQIGNLSLALREIESAADEADLFSDAREWALPKAAYILGLSEAWQKEFRTALSSLSPTLPRQLIHRDLCPGNIILSGDQWGFLRFTLSEKNIRLFDPCYAATAILSETFQRTDKETWFAIYQNILHGYDEAVTLTKDEKAAVPYVILSIQMVCVAWFSEQAQYKTVFEANKKMTTWLIAHFDALTLWGQD